MGRDNVSISVVLSRPSSYACKMDAYSYFSSLNSPVSIRQTGLPVQFPSLMLKSA